VDTQGPTLLTGRATPQGTQRFAARHADTFGDDFFRVLDGLRVSSVGLGTYLGECDAQEDERYAAAARRALERGANLLDTAINYRCQRSEGALGRALQRAVGDELVRRDEVVLCTKGGYIPLELEPPASRAEFREYLRREFIEPGVMRSEDVVAGAHCLAPSFLAHQIARSRRNLGVETIDVYYVHNPEQQLEAVDRAQFRDRMRDAFALLEERCAAGEIARYGCATWNGFRVPPEEREHLSLGELVEVAREVGGDAHHFRVVQLPVNLALTEAVRTPTQSLSPAMPRVTLLQAAAELGLAVVASAPLLQAKLTANLPAQLRDALPGLETDAQRALAFVRALPVLSAALVGMRATAHVDENLAGARRRAGAH
jgi:aryl-alcohol dehydrogenase-like predicted oxidoreductase